MAPSQLQLVALDGAHCSGGPHPSAHRHTSERYILHICSCAVDLPYVGRPQTGHMAGPMASTQKGTLSHSHSHTCTCTHARTHARTHTHTHTVACSCRCVMLTQPPLLHLHCGHAPYTPSQFMNMGCLSRHPMSYIPKHIHLHLPTNEIHVTMVTCCKADPVHTCATGYVA